MKSTRWILALVALLFLGCPPEKAEEEPSDQGEKTSQKSDKDLSAEKDDIQVSREAAPTTHKDQADTEPQKPETETETETTGKDVDEEPVRPIQYGQAPEVPIPLEVYFDVRRVGGCSFSHDEKLVAYASDAGGRVDIWVQPVAGGEAKQLTHVSGFVHSFAFSPTGDELLFETDRGGNELPHIFLTNGEGAEPTDLMSDYPAGARTAFLDWGDEGKTFLYLSSKRDERYLDLYEYTLSDRQAELLWEASGALSLTLPNRTHTQFIIVETRSDVDNNLYLFSRDTKEVTLLTEHEGEVLYEPTAFSPDGKTLYFTSDLSSEFMALYEMDLASKATKVVLKDEWDVQLGAFSDGWTIFFTVTNLDGSPKVELSNVKDGSKLKVPELGGVGALVPYGFSNSDRYMTATLITDSSPKTLYLVDLQEQKVRQLVEVMPDALVGKAMVAGRSVRIPSFDGREVPAFLYEPEGTGPFPAVIDVHGGPTAQAKRRFEPMIQYLVSKGFVVLVPNVRGSTGYGKSYMKLDNLDLGGGPLQDIVYCKKWMVEHSNVNPDKVVVMGASYGGYMALAAAAFTPGEFAAQVDYMGVSDLKTLVESFPPYWAAYSTFIYKKFGDPNNPEHQQYQHDRSPIHFVDRIVTPLLVVQGENDARVKKDQSDRIVAKLRERKVPVHYLVIPGEGHGFSSNESRLLAYQVADRFLDHYIWEDESVVVLEKESDTELATEPEPEPAPEEVIEPPNKPVPHIKPLKRPPKPPKLNRKQQKPKKPKP